MSLLTLQDLADRWGTDYNTIKVWKHRGKLPKPDQVLGRTPVWKESTIKRMEDNGGLDIRGSREGG